MPAQNPQVSNPRYGFTPKQLLSQQLTDGAPVGVSVPRSPGLRSTVVYVEAASVVGPGSEINIIVEGSNDGASWVTVGQLTPTTYITPVNLFEVLNQDTNNSVVDLQHWSFIRVRAAIVSGAPTFDLTVVVSGIARDCESFVRGDSADLTFANRSGALPPFAAVASPSFRRPAGTQLANCQVVATGVVLGTLSGFFVALQASPDNGASWVQLTDLAQITADGTITLTVDGDSFFSLGAYSLFRFQVTDNGTSDAATAYDQIQFLLSLDSCDWVMDSGSGGGSSALGSTFYTVGFGAPGAEVGDTISIAGQIYDSSGVPLTGVRKIELIVYDTSEAGDLDLANNAQFTAVNTGTAIAGTGTNRIVLDTDANGVFDVDILDAVAETVFLTAVNARGPVPIANAQVLVAAEEASLTFA